MKIRKIDWSFLWLLLLSGATVLVVSLLLSHFMPQSSGSTNRSPTPVIAASAYPPPGNLLPGYSTSPYSTDTYPPPANPAQATNQYYQSKQATGEAYWSTHPTLAPPPTRIRPTQPTGIFDGNISENIRSDVATIINMWQGVVNSEFIQVFAGSLANNPHQGVVFVSTTAPDWKGGSWEQINAPSPSGALRILSEQNGRLKLASENGNFYYFDLPSHQFIASLDAISPPTVTLLPTGTPFLLLTPYP
jgi:hypothetical protein